VRESPGLYLLGGNLLRTRRSSYIAGAGHDTESIAADLHQHLDRRQPAASQPHSIGTPIAVLEERR
jgi:hypothetical protein